MAPDLIAAILPEAPDYVAGDGRWVRLETLRGVIGVSASGLDKMRQRYRRRFEHRDATGLVWIFFPLWVRVWTFEQQ